MVTGTAGRMTRGARALMVVASLLLGVMFFTPVWRVRLVAPQYPEGLGMLIRLNTIEGVKEFDLRSINSLNHYIGMKEIEPDDIAELKYMPWIVAGIAVLGLGVAAAGRRRLLVAWTATLAVLAVAGMYDFWRWSYDYGHNLDTEHAIIVVPGMTYQPPLIGTKQLLNFTATSLPDIGGVAAGLAMALAVAALFLSYRRSARLGVAGAGMLVGCVAAVPRIVVGQDVCEFCHMTVADGRFGAVVVTSTGKQFTFDSVDCMLEYLRQHASLKAKSLWVMDAGTSGTLVPAEQATYIVDGALRAPMGPIVSFGSASGAASMKGATGQELSWNELRAKALAPATNE